MKLDLIKKLLEFLSSHPEDKFIAKEIGELMRETF